MDTSRLRITSALAFSLLALVVMLLLLGLPGASHAAGPLYVAPDGNDAMNCSSLATRCRSVQHAVDLAANGDEIRVAAGTYFSLNVRPRQDVTTTGVVTQVVYISKTVTIRGGYTADFSNWDPEVYSTTLDARGRGRGVYITGNISPTLEGLRIIGGNAAGMTGYSYFGEHDVGGGVYVISAAATLRNNQIFSNTAPFGGGGVFLGNSAAQVSGNAIFSNAVTSGGGGLFLYKSAATLSGNTVASNTSTNIGGGLYLFYSDAALQGNTIVSNTASNFGGGILIASRNPTLSDNIFSNNAANKGGGLYLWYSYSLLTNNVIANNRASSVGSGLWLGGSNPRLLQTTLTHNTGGDGSGIYATSDGGSVFSSLVMTNTILVSHTIGITATLGSSSTLNGVLWYGNTINTGGAVTATNAITGNPAFAADGYHLTIGSSAINAGVASGVTTDIDGEPRLSPPDLGADEYKWWTTQVFLPLILKQ